MLYAIIGALVLVVIVLGFAWYREANRPQGVNVEFGNGHISIDHNGVSVETD